jgi:sterol desaturase/sphingolipid hydroxylase (fatty acid hydroxylase superfamily)
VHHSKVRAETDSNYSSVFSWWDRLFRTIRWHEPQTIELGLEYTGERETRNLGTMLVLPVFKPGRTLDPCHGRKPVDGASEHSVPHRGD